MSLGTLQHLAITIPHLAFDPTTLHRIVQKYWKSGGKVHIFGRSCLIKAVHVKVPLELMNYEDARWDVVIYSLAAAYNRRMSPFLNP